MLTMGSLKAGKTYDVPVISLHRNDPMQVGDQASTPVAYGKQLRLPWLATAKTVDILDPGFLEQNLSDSVVIIGGGGLTFGAFQANLRRVIDMRPRALIWWGGGHNIHVGTSPYKSHGRYQDLTPQELMYPGYLQVPPFDAIGVRDPASTQAESWFGRRPLPYVPCSSVMHPALEEAQDLAPRHEAVGYIQKDPLMPRLPGLPTMSNATHSDYNYCRNRQPADRYVTPAINPTNAMRFISQGNVVITNSYHGALWAQMMRKAVVIVDGWSTKFHRLPVQEAIFAVEFKELQQDFRAVLGKAIARRDAHSKRLVGLLADARKRNIDFGRTVERILEAKGIKTAVA